ncbi:MAG: hypothetical protein OEW04_06575 [Nitrospirota bacterium]|nr:hypothetical protein [Nitrospirota bacterium]
MEPVFAAAAFAVILEPVFAEIAFAVKSATDYHKIGVFAQTTDLTGFEVLSRLPEPGEQINQLKESIPALLLLAT